MKEFKPHKYQENIIERMFDQSHLALWVDMGLGKTVTILTWVLFFEIYYGYKPKVLVVAPLKVAQSTWDAEAEAWEHTKNMNFNKLLDGRTWKKKLSNEADVHIINRDKLVALVSLLGAKWDYDVVILDESSTYKNHKAKRFKALSAIKSKIKHMYQLTGTPSPNGYMGVWSQIYLLDQGERLGKNITTFRRRYFDEMRQKTSTGQIFPVYTLKDGAEKEIQEAIKDLVISLKAEDYLNLPEVIEQVVPIQLPMKVMKAYREVRDDFITQLEEGEITSASKATALSKMKQVAGGYVYDEDKVAHHLHDEKLIALDELIESLDEPVIVAYWFKPEKKALLERFKDAVYLENDQQKRDWNEGKIKILLIHPASAGYGLNLQKGGRVMIWYTLPNFNLELYQQTVKRLDRQGQGKQVLNIKLLAKGTYDYVEDKILEEKSLEQEELLQALKEESGRCS